MGSAYGISLSTKWNRTIVLANGSLSSNTSNEGEIRKNLLNSHLVDAIVELPDKLFYYISNLNYV